MTDDAALLDPWIDGRPDAGEGRARYELVSPVDGRVASRIVDSDETVVDRAVGAARAAFAAHRKTPAAARAAWLAGAAAEIEADRRAIVTALIRDIGKPVRPATFEANRSAAFVRLVAAEIGALRGETLPLDVSAQGAGRHGFTRRVPYGVVGAITPFNAPANLLVQKVAPALAMGNAVVVKPAPQGVETALIVAPRLPARGPAGRAVQRRARQPRDRGGARRSPRRRGGDLHRRDRGRRCPGAGGGRQEVHRRAGFERGQPGLRRRRSRGRGRPDRGLRLRGLGPAGISAQRVIVDRAVVEDFVPRFVAAARELVVGEAADEATAVGPMVSAAAADRVQAMIDDAVDGGGRLALAPTRRGAILSPAIVVDPPAGARLMREEAFGPVAVVVAADGLDHALAIANDSEFGLQGACFTNDLSAAFRVAEELEVGALWINEGSRFRLDTYPFGGVGRSGFGREGVRYAMEELSQLKFVGIRLP